MNIVNESNSLYDRDYYLWFERQAELLIKGEFQSLDSKNLTEELGDMGKREKSALQNNLIRILQHLLKWEFQTDSRSGSWKASIREYRRRVRKLIRDSPSLKPYLYQIFDASYKDARKLAGDETGLELKTFPEDCPYPLEQILHEEFYPGEK